MAKRKKGDSLDKSYHHGDLRNALLVGAVAHIRQYGVQNLSLRDLARELDVSHAAPYRHFVDKRQLLVTLAEDGYSRLLVAMESALTVGEDIVAQLETAAWTYVAFSIHNPVHAELMFGAELSDRSELPALKTFADRLFAMVESGIERGQALGVVVEGKPSLLAATAWSLVHGVSTLLNNRRMGWNEMGEEEKRRLTSDVVGNLMSGIIRSRRG